MRGNSSLTPLRWPDVVPLGRADDWLWESARCATDLEGRRFLGSLRSMLARVQPGQVEPTTTRALNDPTALCAIIPHRDLGGVALVARLHEEQIETGWCALRSASPADDTAKIVARQGPFVVDASTVGLGQAIACVERELRHPIEVRLVHDRGVAEPDMVEIRIDGTVLVRRRRFCAATLNPFARRRRQSTSTFVTLAGRERSPVALYSREGWSLRYSASS